MIKKGVIVGIFIGALLLFSVMSVSAKWYEVGEKGGESWWGKLFASKPFNVSITMANSALQVLKIFNPGSVTPLEDGVRTVSIKFMAYDSNGFAQIDGAPAVATLNITNPQNNPLVPTLTGDNLRTGYSCAPVPGQSTTFTMNWSCSVDLQYWDISVPDLWTINARITDDAGDSGVNSSNSNAALGLNYLSYESLAGAVIDKNALAWNGVTTTATDLPSDSPVNVTNAGNVAITGALNKYIQVTAYNLTGVTTPSNLFWSESFFADDVNTACAAASGFQTLTAGIANNITGADFARRPKSDPTSNSTVYFCLNSVMPQPMVADNYVANKSTPGNGGSWIIGVLAL